jgi:hypothetical protein
MTGRIESGQLCTIAPIDPAMLDVGDIVLCKVAGSEYLHVVKAIENGRYQVGRLATTAGSSMDGLGRSPSTASV